MRTVLGSSTILLAGGDVFYVVWRGAQREENMDAAFKGRAIGPDDLPVSCVKRPKQGARAKAELLAPSSRKLEFLALFPGNEKADSSTKSNMCSGGGR